MKTKKELWNLFGSGLCELILKIFTPVIYPKSQRASPNVKNNGAKSEFWPTGALEFIFPGFICSSKLEYTNIKT